MLERLLDILDDMAVRPERMGRYLSGPHVLGILIGAVAFWWLFAATGDRTALERIGDVGTALFRMSSIGFVAGATAMATIQFWKNLSPVRGAFHLKYLEEYFKSDKLSEQFAQEPVRVSKEGEGKGAKDAKEAKQGGDTAGPKESKSRRELEWQWNGPAEQVVGQLSQLSQFVIAKPRDQVELLRLLAGSQGAQSVDAYALAVAAAANADEKTAGRIQELAFDVRHHVEQNLDSLLLRMRARWQRRIRAQAATVSMFIGLAAAFVFVDGAPMVLVSTMLASLVFGGFFAWFTRDIVAVIEKWRA